VLVTLYVHQLYPMQPVTAFSHTDVMRPVLLFLRSVAYFPTHHTCPFFTRVSAVRFGLPLITIIADREYWLTPTRSPRFLPPSPFLASSLVIATSYRYRPSPFHQPRASRTSPPIIPVASCLSLQVSRRCARPRSPSVSLSCLISRSQLPFHLA